MHGPARFRGRRRALAWLAGLPLIAAAQTREARREAAPGVPPLPAAFAQVVPGHVMRFPDDEGSHPAFRIEWWYLTGWLTTAARPAGFQITFFRARPDAAQDNPSAFAPRQIIIAHVALSDPAHGRLLHAERAARAAFDLAGARTGRTGVWLDDWSLSQQGRQYFARLTAGEFRIDLDFAATQPHLLQGDGGLSRKGPEAASASYYYSLPHLRVSGTLERGGRRSAVEGNAWLDHEWTSRYMDDAAVGWDWVCANFADGGALMAFRMRDERGGQHWAGGTLRTAGGAVRTFAPHEISFMPGRVWRSARTGANYPVTWTLRAGALELGIEPLMDDQELDARRTTGTVYWEGAVRLTSGGDVVARGYLELTGYWRPFRF